MVDNDETAFLKAIDAAHWEDDFPRFVYADWLDEHGRPEEAVRQRTYKASRRWLTELAVQCGQHCDNYHEVWNEYIRVTHELRWGNPDDQAGIRRAGEEASRAEQWRSFTFEDMVEAGRLYVEGDDVFTQLGRETARGLLSDPSVCEQFWHHWEVVTGSKRRTEPSEWHGGANPFSCSC